MTELNNNDAIIARIKGVPASSGTAETDCDSGNPNVQVLSETKRQIGGVTVTMRFGRLLPTKQQTNK